ncbi:hypothetical protein HG535_0D01230 [Zygotorulaspora mrakii]|uniref:UBX domain-containing protein n=1 Tax=Zygotorulaspora mrakii TaxID=42260 RepID=A0A7H9B166_ZYGMR|nr:uncharacterized protein HG535_0D01230 [Zygotorulaspora mrakii]QLG72415.1 hypothetical protein HG535_0D01230 [Zygotorulaspora mrakii]
MDLFRRILHGGEVPFTPIPGTFPEPQTQQETQTQRRDGSEQEETSRPTTRRTILSRRTIAMMVLQLPLVILHYIMSFMITMVSLIKPLYALQGFYKRKSMRTSDGKSRLNNLLELLSNESERTLNSEDSGLTTYSFGSLYSLENGSFCQDIVQGSYTDLLNACSEQCKFAMIYLHDSLLDNSTEYVNGLLCTEQFTTLIKKYQILLWFSDVSTSEGLQVANALKVRQFPFLGLLSLKAENKIELFGRMEGSLTQYKANFLENMLGKAYSKLLQIRQQRQNNALQQLIREQQDNRYNESLSADQRRERERATQRDTMNQAIEQARLKMLWLLWRKSTLAPEPSSDSGIPTCKVAIRADSGERVIRRFDASLPIEEIYAFVELQRTPNTLDAEESQNTGAPPRGYHHQYEFTLVSPVPRKELEPSTVIHDETAIFPSGTIIIENVNRD